MAFGNVNVKFSPCKAVGQLKSAAAYILESALTRSAAG